MRYFITMIALFLIGSVDAQQIEKQVISSTGNDVSAGSYQLSQTVGESAVETYTSGSFILGQGFQQVDEKTAIAIKEMDLMVAYNLYPNPTNDVVNLELTVESVNTHVFIDLVDLQGRLIKTKKLELMSNVKAQIQLSLKNESSGIYFLKISNSLRELVASIEISKL